MELKTREDYAALLKKLTAPVRGFYSPAGARLKNITGGASYSLTAQENEGCMRVLWGLFPLWAGNPAETFFRDVYASAFRAGTDPASPEYWGDRMSDRDQRFVEYATLGAGLLLCPEVLLGNLSERERERFAAYVGLVNQRELCHNNWLFFRILANSGLRRAGLPHSWEQVERDFAEIETFYLGDGWYSDGAGTPRRDYYTAFAIHFYSLLYAAAMEGEDPGRAAVFRERAALFARDFLYYFDRSGASVAYGRSQTYRFAQTAFFSALVYAGVEALPLGVVKGIINRNLRYFLGMPICDTAGLLSVGYGYPNLIMSEQYNGSGSPYWAFKTFLILALPESHPYFSAEELPYPETERLHPLPHALLLAQKTDTDTVLLGGGQTAGTWLCHGAEKYAKFAYSAAFGFSVPRGDCSLELAAPDSMLCFRYLGTFFVRRESREFRLEGDTAVSVWSPFEGVTVTTVLTPAGNGHLRRHTVKSTVACTAYDCGFALPRGGDSPDHDAVCGENAVTLTVPAARETLEDRSCRGRVGYLCPAPNTNLVASRTVLPYAEHDIPVGETVIETYVCAERLP